MARVCPHCKKEKTRITVVGRDGTETIKWICTNPSCYLKQRMEESKRRRAA
jgi:hypothetical protein